MRHWRVALMGVGLSAMIVAGAQADDDMPTEPAGPMIYEMYAERFRDDGLQTRLLSRFEVLTGEDGVDQIRLVSLRELGKGQELLLKTDADIRFPVSLERPLPDQGDIRNLTPYRGPFDATLLDVVADFALLYGARPGHAEETDKEDTTEGRKKGKPLFNMIMDALSKDDEPAAPIFDAAPEQLVTLDWSRTPGSIVRRECRQTSGRHDVPETGAVEPFVYRLRIAPPAKTCQSLAGLVPDGVNLYEARAVGDDWTYLIGSERGDITATVEPDTGRITEARLEGHLILTERTGCTQYGALCNEPQALRAEHHVELRRMPDGHRRF